MSPTLFSKRLKELEAKGIIARQAVPGSTQHNYIITAIGNELGPIVFALGQWAHKHVEAEVTLECLDAGLLMWNMRRNIDCTAIKTSNVDLCMKDPGFDVDLYVKADLKALTSVWMGLSELQHEIKQQKIVLLGNHQLAQSIDRWMIRSQFAKKA